MEREFNDAGLCVPDWHYMADTSEKIKDIIRLVEKGKYFTISRPRQFGKTTILSLLAKQLNKRDDYVALKITFEEIDPDAYQKQELYIYELLMMLLDRLEFLNLTEPARFVEQNLDQITTVPALSRFITKFIRNMLPEKSVVLLIDEVDKNSNNQLFLTFLGMLRNKYLQRNEGQNHTFHSVILAGVHDIKTLKAKIRPDDERKYNSPWNIAVDFEVDLSFSPREIESMLRDYSSVKGIRPDIPGIAKQLYYYTSGYPWLVSKLCKFIDEKIVFPRDDKNWSASDAEASFRMIVNRGYTSTLFDSLIKNLENNKGLYDLIFQMIINGERFDFIIADPVINLGHLYGIIAQSEQGHCRIHNRIFEQRIYDYMMSKFLRKKNRELNGFIGPEFYTADGLDVRLVLQRFQVFMKEHYSNREARFLEREGCLLFLSYLRPIINGRGFDFKEPHVGDERRMDIVITCRNQRYVIELKRWYGAKYHQEGLKQLSGYLDMYSLKEGYLLIFDFNKNKEYKEKEIEFEDKQIFAVWV
ncbi:MAG: AAA family ATPase [Desulfobacterales bacterium]|nr:AAA family ATPase [Desulfobacterales bacterium]